MRTVTDERGLFEIRRDEVIEVLQGMHSVDEGMLCQMRKLRFLPNNFAALVFLSLLAACDTDPVEPTEAVSPREYPIVCDDWYSEAEVQTIKFGEELLIKKKSVVNDPCRTGWTVPGCGTKLGKWTAWQHFTGLAGGSDPSAFLHDWFKTFYKAGPPVNGQQLTLRTLAEKTLVGWRLQSGCNADANTPCNLDKNKAPFRLLAIVNRGDVRTTDEFGYGAPVGEGRFVFNILKYDPNNPMAEPKKSKANVIFEYNLPSIWFDPSMDVWEWGNRWHTLSSAPLQMDAEAYKVHLQTKITDVFATAANLAQVRTEEIDFDPAGGLNKTWSFREYERRCPDPINPFCLNSQKRLMPRPVTQTPASAHNLGPTVETSQFATWFKSLGVVQSVLDGNHVVPLKIGNVYFRGAESLASEASNSTNRTLWGVKQLVDNTLDVITVNGEVPYVARHQFGATTCNGCHYDETGTSMMFIRERDALVESTLAPFLQTSTMAGETHNFTMLGFEGDEWSYEFNEPRRRACEALWAMDGNVTPLTRNNGAPH